ncbi:MAG: hypothetical protein JWN23_1244 [Rhodocyclales bacterium]|nr:hypothetical protein [Rhodocyclales bacterium]
MRKLSALIVWLFVCAFTSPSAFAWGSEGHRLVAEIAEHYLTPVAQRKVQTLLRAESLYGVAGCPVKTLADAATWPDCLRGFGQTYAHTFAWHFDDIPLCGAPDKTVYCKDGQCLSTQTQRLIGVLADKSAPVKDRLEALKFVAHFIGDAHQPLHATDNDDRGGNEIPVSFFGGASKSMNLHHAWDTDLLVKLIGTDTNPAGTLALQIDDKDIKAWGTGDVNDWLKESHQLAKDVAYADLPSPPACGAKTSKPETVGPRYYNKVKDTVALQIKRAGVRLAKVLNESLR